MHYILVTEIYLWALNALLSPPQAFKTLLRPSQSSLEKLFTKAVIDVVEWSESRANLLTNGFGVEVL